MTSVCIGIPVRERADLLAATFASLRAQGDAARVVAILDGVDGMTRRSVSRLRIESLDVASDARGDAACFNALVRQYEADVYVLLENGARVASGWLDALLAALAADATHGLAGPSTNRSWNEQGAFPNAGGTAAHIEQTARDALNRFGRSTAYLEPLHSLADFCYAVLKPVILRIGAADESYGLGPCWEMDYNVRAARAGFRGVWARSAYVWRPPATTRKRHELTARFEANKRLYQDRFCGLRLTGATQTYDAHCTGDVCPHFAPRERIVLSLDLRTSDIVKSEPSPRSELHTLAVADNAAPPAKDLVSCIMPTRNRRAFLSSALDAFLRQDYPHRELIVIDDGEDCVGDLIPSDPRIRYVREQTQRSVGAKRNLACSIARGTVIVHWDDDDWHAPWRVRYQLTELERARADICGLTQMWFHDPVNDAAWQYRYPGGRARWLAGGSLCYRRTLWERHRFADISIGEDTRFVRELAGARLLALDRDDFYVARVHAANTCRKHTNGTSWHKVAADTVRALIDAMGAVATLDASAESLPLVSCIMPTADRPAFAALSIGQFLAQDYPNRELIVVDDGHEPIGHLCVPAENVRHVRLTARRSIGAKRNLACSQARGAIVMQWDDDDWYAADRISRQVAPIIGGRADLTGVEGRWVMTLPAGEFWTLAPALHRRMFFADVHGGTLTFRKSVWDGGARYPDRSLAEDAAFLQQALGRGQRLERVDNDGFFIYSRHGTNAWRFAVGQFADAHGWTHASAPPAFDSRVLGRYQAAATAVHASPLRPLVRSAVGGAR